jgi:hypothetical protein
VNWFHRLKAWGAKEWVRVLSIREPQHWRNADTMSAAGEAGERADVLALSAVWACVNLLAGTIASLPLMVYRTDAAARTWRGPPALPPAARQPELRPDRLDFWEFGRGSIELRGNMPTPQDRTEPAAVIALSRSRRRRRSPAALRGHPLPLDRGRESYDEPQETSSTSAASAARRSAAVDPQPSAAHLRPGAAIEKAAGSHLRQRPAPVRRPDLAELPEGRAARRVEEGLQEVRRRHERRPPDGAGGRHQPGSADDQPRGRADAAVAGFSVEEVCRFFGVPPFMVGHTEKTTSWGTGLRAAVLGFQKFTLRRRLKRIEQAIEKQLLTPADRSPPGSPSSSTSRACCAATARRARPSTTPPSERLDDHQRGPRAGEPAAGRGRRRARMQMPRTSRSPRPGKSCAARRRRPPRRRSHAPDKSAGAELATKSIALDLKAVGDDGTFEGYGSVFGVVDSYREVVEPGAFMASLAKRKAKGIKLLWQHDASQPIGVWDDLAEDSKGLWGKGRLLKDVSARPPRPTGC